MTTPYTTRTSCRVCGSTDLVALFSLGTQFCSDFVPVDGVTAGPRVPIDIELCRNCTLVQQKHTAPQDFLYTRHYWYRSGVTATMREALRDVARAACAVAGPEPGDVVLDIGSNDGTLLRAYDEFAPGVVKVGVEPATNLAEEGKRGVDILIKDFWSAGKYLSVFGEHSLLGRVQRPPAKVVTALGMFYDLESPNDFIHDVARVLAPDGVFVAQLMCLKQTLERGDVGNFAHEHLEFYSLRSLDYLFSSHGLSIFRVEENTVNGGSYRIYARHRGAHLPPDDYHQDHLRNRIDEEMRMALDRPKPYADFFRRLESNKAECVHFIRNVVAAGKKVWVYGSSTKGNVILQYYGLDRSLITAAADRSPEKHGRFTVGTGIPIVSEEGFRKAAPDCALVLPYAFLPEFIEREATWRAYGGRFLVPLPEFRVI